MNNMALTIQGSGSEVLLNYLESTSGISTSLKGSIQVPPGIYDIPSYKLEGTVQILDRFILVTGVTIPVTNFTNFYTYVSDGIVDVDITKSGLDVSSLDVGTLIIRDKNSLNSFTVGHANQPGFIETIQKISVPYFLTETQSPAQLDTYIYVHFETTQTLDFDFVSEIRWISVNGGKLIPQPFPQI
jgi:hypothetical protein